jgi:hypothetical protein
MPIAEALLPTQYAPSYSYTTKMVVCRECGLGQLTENINKEEVFNKDYAFLSSKSISALKSAREFADNCIKHFNLTDADWVLEIGSNDGYLLQYFKKYNIDVLGIDPSQISVTYASVDGIPTITDFFNSKLATKLLELKGYPKLIIANNVMAHVPDIKDFMNGISILCNDDTLVSIENPSIMNILKYNHFDTIYHEHYSYLSCNSVSILAKKYNLNLYSLDKTPLQGESNRYWLSKTIDVQESVINEINKEKDDGLFSQEAWTIYYSKLKKDINAFYNKVKELYNSGSTVCGYAASSKAVELLNFAKIEPNWIKSIADDAVEKQNKFLPGLKTPIINIDNMLSDNPTDIIVFSWNIYDEVVAKLKSAGYNGNIWKWNDK